FYDKHGGKTIFFARFLPVIRSFSSPVAGIARMPYSKFLFYSASGATVWIPFFTLLGFFLGTWLAKYYWLINLILSATLAFIIFSILYHIFKLKFTRKHV
ncbi:MAG: DedA family protein, partial [Chlorobiales bacterium]|nr:DedA family protein [Chlorobiales bacterium]